ncbi:uncharacterized protein A4U43_C02F8600 [Asparagus officinalis]|uniref:Uncharacterized protein n=1 Tax=Asparagus officinalis TaxID=4686 RepID=A0A5P1FH33_ASPOF|nr:uncharacterized protein A4U43_C02F8600 [Asparagus officinalis]
MVVGAYRHRRRSSIKEITWSEDVNSDAKAYQNKAIEIWDDIYVLVGTDRATGEGAEQIDDSIVAMDMEGANEGESSSREMATQELQMILTLTDPLEQILLSDYLLSFQNSDNLRTDSADMESMFAVRKDAQNVSLLIYDNNMTLGCCSNSKTGGDDDDTGGGCTGRGGGMKGGLEESEEGVNRRDRIEQRR